MAKTVDNLQKYWQEIATKAGLAPEAVASIGQTLGDESVARTFRQAFVPVAEHHSTLDEMRNRTTAREAELNDWYQNSAMPAYQANLGGIERLRQYESLYGDISGQGGNLGTTTEGFLRNKEDLDKYLEDKLRAERAGNLALMKALPRMQVDYYNRFKEVLDPDDLEKLAVQKGLPPEAAYTELIKPKVEAQQKVEWEQN